ncbi:MAG: beta-lactamase family protein [Candidatus Lambdaproteobacteria bacterium]|nr:beta-lactamase family protein [Candidatus Lambdaproteobacteria bacterium]
MDARSASISFTRKSRQDLERLLEDALRRKIFPGIELLVAVGDELLLHEAWGQLEVGPEDKPLQTGTLFDIASITKPIATATCVLVLLEQGALGMEDKVARFFPEFDTPEKGGISVRHLLTHTSGLPDWVDLYSETQGPAEALQRLLNTPLGVPTGSAMIYSDVGFLILGELVRRLSGTTLAEFFHRHVGHPLGLRETSFHPLEQGLALTVAPTQYCPYREQLLRGVVHDENSHVFGGEGGNAGLFSTARDLWRFARMILGGGALDGVRILSSRTVQRMIANHNPPRLPPRGLGWDMKGEGFGYMSCGELMRAGAVGHTGFTGTSLWIEPQEGLTVVVLTNRVNIARERNQADMMRFRPRLHNLLVSTFCDR